MRLTILSRASDLARLQALLVGRALTTRWPEIDIAYLTRTSAGDRDGVTPLASMPDKGAFTSDLSGLLASGSADMVVHSWKDLPLEGRPDTVIAATLERADPRDVLLIRRDVVAEQPRVLDVLSSSPRRTWLLHRALPDLLPWRVVDVHCVAVRGNIQTRLTRLIEGRGHALVVAKAALDRLLGFGSPFEAAAHSVRDVLDQCQWMVLPLRDVPGAPAQGAIAIETAAGNTQVRALLGEISHAPTWAALMREREILAAHGGGCHEAVGATVLPREYGFVTSVMAMTRAGSHEERWTIESDKGESVRPPRAAASQIWPRHDERGQATRRALIVAEPGGQGGYLVSRAEALPEAWTPRPDRLVWAAGGTTWRRLAGRGVWVNGCADGLGDREAPAVDHLAGHMVDWLRLTHTRAAADDSSALATYEVDEPFPEDLTDRTHFFWTSGQLFLEALARYPALRSRWHASGAGRTAQALRGALGSSERLSVWLDYEHWYREIVA